MSRIGKALSEQNAILASKHQTVVSLNSKIERLRDKGGLSKIRDVVSDIRKNEANMGAQLEFQLTADENAPDEVLSYIDKRVSRLWAISLLFSFGGMSNFYFAHALFCKMSLSKLDLVELDAPHVNAPEMTKKILRRMVKMVSFLAEKFFWVFAVISTTKY